MKKKTKKLYEGVYKLIKMMNVLLITAPFAVCWMCYYADRTYAPYYAKGNYLIIALFLLLYAIYGQVYDALLVSMNRISETVYSQGLAALIADAVMYLICWLLTKHLPAAWPMIIVFVIQLICSAVWSLCAHKWYFYRFPPKRSAIIYDTRKGMERLIGEYGLDTNFDVRAVMSIEEYKKQTACDLPETEKNGERENGTQHPLEGTEVVFLFGIHSRDRNIILKYCVANHISTYVIPRIGDVLMSSAKQVHMFHLPILQVERYHPPAEYVLIKRGMDLLIAGAALILFSPVLLLTAAAIKIGDKGPVFYKQRRLTKDGKEFNVLKFRSMRVDAEKDGIARLSTGLIDDRITSVGKWIRKIRIDELPQLLNILKGDMTLVGPRPERPEIAAQYEKELPEFKLRLQAKAGLTGYAQVYGKYNTMPYDKLQMDLMYLAKPSVLEDFRILFATVKILFQPESTEGVAQGAVTAADKRGGGAKQEIGVNRQ